MPLVYATTLKVSTFKRFIDYFLAICKQCNRIFKRYNMTGYPLGPSVLLTNYREGANYWLKWAVRKMEYMIPVIMLSNDCALHDCVIRFFSRAVKLMEDLFKATIWSEFY